MAALPLARERCGTAAVSSSSWERLLLCCVLRYPRPQGLGMVGEFLGQSSGVCWKALSIPAASTAGPAAPRAGARPTAELRAGRAEVAAAAGFVWTLNINTEIMEGVPEAGLTHLEAKLPRSRAAGTGWLRCKETPAVLPPRSSARPRCPAGVLWGALEVQGGLRGRS